MENKKKYTAYIDVFDNDYRSYCGQEEIQVDSIEEAREYCEKNSWRAISYDYNCIMDNITKEIKRK